MIIAGSLAIIKNGKDITDSITQWLKEIMTNALSNVVDSKRIMIGMIFNRFRCFLSNKATFLIPKAYYYGYTENYYFHKKLIQHIRFHLHNNSKNKKLTEIEVPDDRNDKIFWALSKKFIWNEVSELISIMDEIGIDFDKDLDNIKKQLNDNSNKFKTIDHLFEKLITRINYLIKEFHTHKNINNKTPVSSSDDENDDE